MFDELNDVELHNLSKRLRSARQRLYFRCNTVSSYDTYEELGSLVGLVVAETHIRRFITVVNGV